MTAELRGMVLRRHTSTGFEDIGRIIHCSRSGKDIFWMPFPRKRRSGETHKSYAIGAPRVMATADLDVAQAEKEISLVPFATPQHWQLTDEQLEGNVHGILDPGRTYQRKTRRWLAVRDEREEIVRPIFSGNDLHSLLELGTLGEAIRTRATELGHRDVKVVRRAVRLSLLGCQVRNCLLPDWSNSGGRGKPKEGTVKVGRRPRRTKRDPDAGPGYLCSAEDRLTLQKGWRKYKKRDVPVYDAYLLTCAEFWPGEGKVARRGRNGTADLSVSLAEPAKRPTLAQFKWAAKSERLSAREVNLGERVRRLTCRVLRGRAQDDVIAVGQLGLIDSTSEDQNPVSERSRLILLPSTYRTILVDVRSDYIIGLHSGFETPSTLTSLLAILHGATSKVEYCARYGIAITEEMWHSRAFKRVRADNGELKSELGIKTMNLSQTTAEFVSSYDGPKKGQVEGKHHVIHRAADHKNAGSSRGQSRQRGEETPDKDACRTHAENMVFVIRAILRHNNEEPVPHMLTLEMRKDNVQPTRKAIYEWYLRTGYVASEPNDLDLLRATCLPRLSAKVHRDGVYVFDPRSDHKRYIPQLCYSSPWLIRSGLTERAARRRMSVDVMLDPSDLSQCFIMTAQGLQRLERQTADPLANGLSLCEHLYLTDEDQDVVEQMRPALEQSDAQRLKDNARVNKAARKEKRKELQGPTEASSLRIPAAGKRENRKQELAMEQLKRLGLPVQQAVVEIAPPPEASAGANDYLSATSSLMDEFRNRRDSL